MVSRKDLVDRAIAFKHPQRVPVIFWNCDQTEGDIMLYHLSLAREGRESSSVERWGQQMSEDESGKLVSASEWGYSLESIDETMGHPTEIVLPDLGMVDGLQPPALREEERMAGAPAFFAECGDRYRLASFDLSGFTIYSLLRGFENSMADLLNDPERSAKLLELIWGWECDVMRIAARHGFHGIHFADDWATQTGLAISPLLWRQLFKPRYRRQFSLAHELGLHVWYHCCGNFTNIAEDFAEIGVDVLNIAQPNVVDINQVGTRLRGKQAFMLPISYQTVSITGTPEQIQAEAQRLYDALAVPAGGFIGYVEKYSVMGMSEENYRACGRAWRRLGCKEADSKQTP